MDTNFQFEHAQRFDHESDAHQDTARARRTATETAPTVVEFGTGWYHDAAIAADKDAFAHPYR